MTSAIPFADAVPDRVIWVSPDGDDSNSGARDAPLASVQLAIDRATPGTAILLLPGEFHGNFQFEKIEGTAEKPIWLAAAEGAGTVTLVSASDADVVLAIRGEDNLVIRDLVLQGGQGGVEIHQSGTDYTDLAANIVFAGNRVVGASGDAIKVGSATNIHIVDNVVDGAGDQGIDFVGVTNARIEGNDVFNVTGSSGIFAKGGSSDIRIANNYVHDVAGDGILVGGWTSAENFLPGTDYEARDVEVVGNVVENAVKRPLSVRGAENVDIHDNWFGSETTNEHVVLVGSGSPELSPPPPSTGVAIHDNVFDRSTNFADIEAGSDATFAHNVLDGVIAGDMRTDPPVPGGAFVDTVPAWLLDAPVWPTSARPANNVSGTSGPDSLTGTAGHDNISGGSGDDTMAGGAGDDTYSVGTSRDVIVENAGEGVDTADVYASGYALAANVENLTVRSSAGGSYAGNELDNILRSGIGSDTLSGGGGNDLFIFAAAGGDDRVADFTSGDVIDLRAFAEIDSFAALLARASQAGADTIIAFDGGGTLTLASVLRGDLKVDDFFPCYAAVPSAPADADSSANLVAENAAPGTLVGATATATLPGEGTIAWSLLDDAGGRFAIDPTTGVVSVADGSLIDYEAARQHVIAIAATSESGESSTAQFLIDVADLAGVTLVGGDGNDVFKETSAQSPTAETDAIYGRGGNDMIDGLAGGDLLAGGGGVDTASYATSLSGVTVRLQDGVARGGSAEGDRLVGIEGLVGSSEGDALSGSSAANVLRGLAGDDRLSGLAGHDTIAGGFGNDILRGGAGPDSFVFNTAPGVGNVDAIADFTAADTLVLARSAFRGLGPPGTLDAARFQEGAAHDAGDRILYNPSNGWLFYDADGNRPGHAVHFATLANHAALTSADILVL